MGLFDEIERNIREAMAEAQKAQQPRPERRPQSQEPPQQQRAPEPKPAPAAAEPEIQPHVKDFWDYQSEHKNSQAKRRQDTAYDHHETGNPIKEHDVAHRNRQRPRRGSTRTALREMFANPHSLRAAILANEIIGKPLSLRKQRPF